MGEKARWGPFSFLVSPSKIVSFEDFTTSVTLKTNNGNDTSGTDATNTRGLELQQMTFVTRYMRAFGVDPRERLDAWTAQVGNSYTLYIGNKRFGPEKMMLTGVSVSELLMNNDGSFLSVTLGITLQEYSSSASSATSSESASTYAQTVANKKAMNATASASDRNTKKLTAMEKRLQ